MRFILTFAILAFVSDGIYAAVVGRRNGGYQQQFKYPRNPSRGLSTPKPNEVENEEFNAEKNIPQFRHHRFDAAPNAEKENEPIRLFPFDQRLSPSNDQNRDDDDSDNDDDEGDNEEIFVRHPPRDPRSFGYWPARGKRDFRYQPSASMHDRNERLPKPDTPKTGYGRYNPQGPGSFERRRNVEVIRERRSFGYYPSRGKRDYHYQPGYWQPARGRRSYN
uniref:Uncharacterized protein n=1 Tax=Panagrolaimus superbus TaxID=310955 RepID=A0A914YLK5_9BILA